MEKEDSKKLELYYIRHSYSYFNLYSDYKKHESGPFRDIDPEEMNMLSEIHDFFSTKLADSKLSSEGISQCSKAAPKYHDLPIKCIFVSPLKKALETTALLFKDHPLRSQMKIIVHPLVTEMFSGCNEISCPLSEKREYYEKQGFDFSLLDSYENPDLYFLYDLNKPESEEILHEIKTCNKVASYVEILANIVRAKDMTEITRHKKPENYVNVRKRAKMFAEYAVKFCEENKLQSGEVAVVSHEVFIGHSLATDFNYYSKAIFEPIKIGRASCRERVSSPV